MARRASSEKQTGTSASRSGSNRRRRPGQRLAEGETRSQLIEAALEEFAATGFAGGRVDSISRRAKLNKQLLYYYFGSKRGLYRAVLAQMGRWTATKYSSGPIGIKAWVREYLRRSLTDEHRQWRRLLMWEALEVDGRQIEGEADRRRGYELSVQAIMDAQEAGELDPEFDPQMLALTINSIILAPEILPQVTKLMTGNWPDTPRFAKRQRELLDQIVSRLAAPK